MARALGFHALGGLENCLGAFPGAQARFESLFLSPPLPFALSLDLSGSHACLARSRSLSSGNTALEGIFKAMGAPALTAIAPWAEQASVQLEISAMPLLLYRSLSRSLACSRSLSIALSRSLSRSALAAVAPWVEQATPQPNSKQAFLQPQMGGQLKGAASNRADSFSGSIE